MQNNKRLEKSGPCGPVVLSTLSLAIKHPSDFVQLSKTHQWGSVANRLVSLNHSCSHLWLNKSKENTWHVHPICSESVTEPFSPPLPLGCTADQMLCGARCVQSTMQDVIIIRAKLKGRRYGLSAELTAINAASARHWAMLGFLQDTVCYKVSDRQ